MAGKMKMNKQSRIVLTGVAVAILAIAAVLLTQHLLKEQYLREKYEKAEVSFGYLSLHRSNLAEDFNAKWNWGDGMAFLTGQAFSRVYSELTGRPITPQEFTKIIENGPPSENKSFWQPVEGVDEDVQKRVYHDFVDHRDGDEKDKGRGFYANEYRGEYIGGPDSAGPCLYNTYAANKGYFDQLMYEYHRLHYDEHASNPGESIRDWPYSMLVELCYLFNTGETLDGIFLEAEDYLRFVEDPSGLSCLYFDNNFIGWTAAFVKMMEAGDGNPANAEARGDPGTLKAAGGGYDWDGIRRLLLLGPDQVTGAEFAALAKAYLEMTEYDDIAHFIACGYETRGVGGAGLLMDRDLVLSDTARLINTAVTIYVINRASATVWVGACNPKACGSAEEEGIRRMIENMQVLQIANQVCGAFPENGSREYSKRAMYRGEYDSPYPVRLSKGTDGILMIEAATDARAGGAGAGGDARAGGDAGAGGEMRFRLGKPSQMGFGMYKEGEEKYGEGTDCFWPVYILGAYMTQFGLKVLETDDRAEMAMKSPGVYYAEKSLGRMPVAALPKALFGIAPAFYPFLAVPASAAEKISMEYELAEFLADGEADRNLGSVAGQVNYSTVNCQVVIHHINGRYEPPGEWQTSCKERYKEETGNDADENEEDYLKWRKYNL